MENNQNWIFLCTKIKRDHKQLKDMFWLGNVLWITCPCIWGEKSILMVI